MKAVLLKTAEKFTGHGIPNLLSAKTKLARLAWLTVILFFTAFCSFYIVNSLDDFFSYEVVSSIRVINEITMTFPAVVICGWYSEYAITEGMFHCKFNNQDCQIIGGFEKIDVFSSGTDTLHFCIRFNGMNKSGEYKNELLTVQKAGIYGPGLSVSFLVPDDVRFKIKIKTVLLIVY